MEIIAWSKSSNVIDEKAHNLLKLSLLHYTNI